MAKNILEVCVWENHIKKIYSSNLIFLLRLLNAKSIENMAFECLWIEHLFCICDVTIGTEEKRNIQGEEKENDI